MAWASKTYTFSPSTTAASAEVNQNFDDAFSAINTAMPTGGVILWSGAIVDIPSGWALCNGASGTPDLRDKFIVGAGSSYAVGATGGAATINLQHLHTVNSHLHTTGNFTLTTNEIPAHVHTIYCQFGADGQNRRSETGSGNYAGTGASHGSVDSAGGGATHNHGNTGAASPGTDNQLSMAQSILPPYYALAWIRKT